MVSRTSLYNSLGIQRIFWSHLDEGIGHGSIVPSFGALNRKNESLASVKLNFNKPSPPDSSSYIDIQLTSHSLNFWSHLEEGIGYGSIMPSFGALNRENESLASVILNFDKPSPPDSSSYIDIQLTRHSQNFLESFRRGYWPRIDYA